jgi:histidine triad (HIT) family protein
MDAGSLDSRCLFCRIIGGQIPCHRIDENQHVLAFLDINPLTAGHTIVVPKHHAEFLEALPPEWVEGLARALGPLAARVARALGAAGYNVLVNNGQAAGQVIPHVHFHIIPRREGDGLGYRWKARAASESELAELAARIASVPAGG